MTRQTRLSVAAVAAFAYVTLPSSIFSQTAPPGPPRDFKSFVSGNTVALNWLSPLTGGEPSAYLLEAALSPGGTIIGQLLIGATSIVIPGVPNGTYYVTMRAVNDAGPGDRSEEIIIAVPGDGGSGGCTSPPNPTHIHAITFTELVTVHWRQPVGGCPATSFILQVGSAPGLTDVVVINAGAQTAVSGGWPPAGTYYLRVLAVNTYGASSPSREFPLEICARWGCI